MKNTTTKKTKNIKLFYILNAFIVFIICGLSLLLNIAYADVVSNNQVITNHVPHEHVVWNKMPISFVVPVNQERLLNFPDVVTVHNTDPNLTTDKISLLNNAGTLYIKAKKSFDPIRIPIVIKNTGEVILVDLSAQTHTDNTPVDVILADKKSTKADNQADTLKINSASMNYPRLMRYAIQHLYSPLRLVENDQQIYRTPMYTSKSVNLIPQAKVIAMPLMSWRGGNLYITAVLLKNVLKRQVYLTPMQLNGRWLSASYYPTNYLTSKGSKHDRTTLFVISNCPFNEALDSMRSYR